MGRGILTEHGSYSYRETAAVKEQPGPSASHRLRPKSAVRFASPDDLTEQSSLILDESASSEGTGDRTVDENNALSSAKVEAPGISENYSECITEGEGLDISKNKHECVTEAEQVLTFDEKKEEGISCETKTDYGQHTTKTDVSPEDSFEQRTTLEQGEPLPGENQGVGQDNLSKEDLDIGNIEGHCLIAQGSLPKEELEIEYAESEILLSEEESAEMADTTEITGNDAEESVMVTSIHISVRR